MMLPFLHTASVSWKLNHGTTFAVSDEAIEIVRRLRKGGKIRKKRNMFEREARKKER